MTRKKPMPDDQGAMPFDEALKRLWALPPKSKAKGKQVNVDEPAKAVVSPKSVKAERKNST